MESQKIIVKEKLIKAILENCTDKWIDINLLKPDPKQEVLFVFTYNNKERIMKGTYNIEDDQWETDEIWSGATGSEYVKCWTPLPKFDLSKVITNNEYDKFSAVTQKNILRPESDKIIGYIDSNNAFHKFKNPIRIKDTQ